MKPTQGPLETLKKELDFVDHAGYRKPIGSRQPLFCMESGVEWKKRTFFEDSPVCPKEKYEACDPQSDCALMRFVPEDLRNETLPCHYIPLNEQGDTIASLEETGNREKIEAAIRSWVQKNIEKMEADSAK
jgi:hypothetical protein